MLDDDTGAALAIGFEIDTADSFGELTRLQDLSGSTEAKLLADFNRIERASTGMVNLAAPTSSFKAFGNAATGSLQATAVEIRRAEKAAEGLILQLERKTSSLGKTSDELLELKVAAAAVAAVDFGGNTNVADRLTEQLRAYKAVQDTLAQDRSAAIADAAEEAARKRAAAEAAVNAELLERSRLQAALDRTAGADRPRAVEAGATFSALSAKVIDDDARAAREAAHAYQLFEAQAAKLGRTMREQEAAEAAAASQLVAQAAAAERLRASIDPAYAAQQRFNREMAEARTLVSAGVISLDDYVGKLRMERTALEESTRSQAKAVDKSASLRQGYQNLGFQIQDVGASLSTVSGPSGLMRIFAQQGGQVFDALNQIAQASGGASKDIRGAGDATADAGTDLAGFGEQAVGVAEKVEGTAGKFGKFASFMAGPWGAAVMVGLTVLGPMVGEMFKFGDALDDAVAKLKKEAEETEAARTAQERFKTSAEGVAAAIRDGTEATRLAVEGMRSSAEASNIAAKNNLEREISIRAVTAAELEQAKVLADNAKSQNIFAGGPGGAQSLVAAQYGARVSQLEQQLADQQKLIEQARARLGQTRIDLAAESAARAADPMLRIKKLYDEQANAAKRAASAQVAAGHDVGAALARELALIETNRKAAIKAEQDKLSARTNTTNQIGRNVTLSEARGIAEGIGGRVTSDHRTYEEQQRLWNKYQAYKSGRGPWAALAAKPGTSNHELDQALDVGKGGGMSLKKLVAAYRAAGVKLTEALDEGDHYHIAWKKVGDAARAQSAEQSAAEREAIRAAATDSQIDNLYKLAAAYDATGGAALIAGVQVKAESDAIKQHGVISAAVAREVNLEIAQRVADAAASTSSMRTQAAAQASVNAMVASGLVPAERAAELVRDQIEDLPLLAAKQAAEQIGNKKAIEEATKALKNQRDARVALTREQQQAAFDTDTANGGKRLAVLREELRLVGATEAVRVHALATIQATQEAEAKFTDPALRAAYIKQQVEIADTQQGLKDKNDAYNASLTATGELFDTIDQSAQRAAAGMSEAFGNAGRAIGDALTIMTGYYADQARLQETHQATIDKAGSDQQQIDRENRLFAMRTSSMQIGAFGDMAAAAKGFFKEGSTGYQAMAAAEKAFRTVQFVLSVRAIAQDAIETGSKIANSVARTAAGATEAVVNAIKSLPFPLNLAAGAATIAALASIGVSIAGAFGGGSKDKLTPANTGTGTVLGDSAAQSESLKRSMDALKEVDTLTNTYARQMAASLKSIDSQIGNVAALVVRAGDVNASAGVKEGFKSDTTGKLLSGIVTGGGLFSKIPVVGSIIGAVGGLIGSLFGSKTTVVGSGLYGKDQKLGSVLAGGYDASYYSDIEKQKKFLGIKTGTSYSTQYSAADAGLENQFTLILKQFNDAIAASAAPLGIATGDVQARLNSFVVSIGKIDLKGLTGEQIQEKLTAVFGAAADKMAATAIPGLERFQKVGEGAFETLVRVASTVEAVGTSLDLLGTATRGFSIDAKVALADQFDSVSDLTSAAGAYFEAFYSKEEQAAAKTAQFAKVFDSLGLAMPASLAGFRQLVDAQDLNTAAGQSTYATLLKLAPAFADLQSAMEGAKSAADVAAERQDLERQMLELQGNTAAIRALDLAKLDASNRELQQQIWAIQDAQEAAKAAEALRDAWTSVGDSIMDEVKRIRGITDAAGGNGFAALQGQFNAATTAARAGDQDAAKSLPALSQALLAAAADQATSRQELARVQAMTAASLAATYGVVTSLASGKAGSSKGSVAIDDVFAAVAQSSPASAPASANDDEVASLKEEITGMRRDINSGLAAIAGNTKGIDRKLGDLSSEHGGMAISVASAA